MSAPEVDAIFDAFNGVTALAKRLGVPITTAHGWKREGRIPRWRMTEIERAAAEDGIELPRSKKKAAA